ncbi:hypothetical protein QBC44DRAFT_135045 [Cladorrhinum sp. PSN332]|nr:hypothetical protein QBC44DRAFT_135045 [Cladorrhinum sp. PSN332]
MRGGGGGGEMSWIGVLHYHVNIFYKKRNKKRWEYRRRNGENGCNRENVGIIKTAFDEWFSFLKLLEKQRSRVPAPRTQQFGPRTLGTKAPWRRGIKQLKDSAVSVKWWWKVVSASGRTALASIISATTSDWFKSQTPLHTNFISFSGVALVCTRLQIGTSNLESRIFCSGFLGNLSIATEGYIPSPSPRSRQWAGISLGMRLERKLGLE